MTQQLDTDRLTGRDGSAVGIRHEPQSDILETRDSRGRVLFEYDTATGKAVLHLPGANLEVRSVEGKVEIGSDRGIKIKSGGAVEIEGERGVTIGREEARIEVKRKGIAVEAPELEARIKEFSYEGELVNARAREAKFAWGKMEQVVGRMFTWAKNVYERVEELLHTRAGRVRIEAQRAYLLQTGHARVQAKDDVRIQGKTINLG